MSKWTSLMQNSGSKISVQPDNQEINRQSLIAHIEGLQLTLAKRNARIAELEKAIKPDPIELLDEEIQKRIKKAYSDGARKAYVEFVKLISDARDESWNRYNDLLKEVLDYE